MHPRYTYVVLFLSRIHTLYRQYVLGSFIQYPNVTLTLHAMFIFAWNE
jgi:hypothetical protein